MTVIDSDTPFDATVVYVWNDHLVNLVVRDHCGNTFVATSVPLLQPGSVAPAGSFFAYWMPYQQAQARRDAEVAAPGGFG